MKSLLGIVVGTFVAAMSSAALASQPLVSVDWLKANLDNPEVVVLDIRSAVSGSSKESYARAHIPGAIHSDYVKDGWRVKDKNGIRGMLPGADHLAKLIGGLGIDNDSHVVVVSRGANSLEMGAATRVYWTFKIAGHDKVSILNGGLAAWVAERDEKTKRPVNPLESGVVQREPTTFEVTMRPELLATKEDVQAALEAGTPLIDHRPTHQHLGVTKPGPVARPGTIPGALSVPETWLTINDGGVMRPKAQMTKLYEAAGAPTSGDVINFCNSGHWASLGWFVSSEILGNQNAKLYDGSMIEWSKTDLPMEQKVSLQ
ncbi:sulfurtransferase [Dichotomicrobium thermohalophilum]|uniref:Thiosulfate/3-mercaptopyruvate sulfurtransferase n=1 Tax=Dichotomicrobium thermohalophilum TaxID=933063 RepID=A0A397Q739_9HYPH|nr:sulfurtransferase [Dichotomicrobium thermohalophilum]RIA56868.1 thiosulfate/3-mercaptopyruvate sulfurtransferase [Dichotomicrobium thermohalophilum]